MEVTSNPFVRGGPELKLSWGSQTLGYRSGMVNSKSFVGKDFLRIKWKFELINAL